ncbi:MAG TPA: tetraacyldisaccharide 4'-kinase [Acidobacteriaceae bacterium]|nr:tetraacyldisaccharide 4'-kinase [Acidobacteriaceae bacterium]
MIRPFAYLVPLYAAAVGAKNAAYDRGWAKPERLAWPVVSVGNLSVGGAGKTPLVVRLAQLLAAESARVDVLSRGYGRRDTARVERVDPQGDAARFGDEPLLITRAAQVPVYVGASRYEAGLLAEREASIRGIHLLDDGFQHRKLARDIDIVVLHATDFEEKLLPAGRLREPLSALRRASVIVLRAEDRALEPELRKRGIPASVWIQHRRLAVENVTRAVAFCGIARPDEFFAALHGEAVELAATVALRDHQHYSNAELDRLAAAVRESGAECLVTTEKDAARLTREQREQLERTAPLRVARLEVSLEDEAAAVRQLLNLL